MIAGGEQLLDVRKSCADLEFAGGDFGFLFVQSGICYPFAGHREPHFSVPRCAHNFSVVLQNTSEFK
jgi:hypothetical protein